MNSRISAVIERALTPSRLWKDMTADTRLAAARAFWADGEALQDQVQAAFVIAQQKKFRPKTVLGLDLDKKARHLAGLPTLPDAVAARILVVYHLAEQRPMMGTFLDALGIAHDNGLIQDDQVVPDAARIGPAAAGLAERFPAPAVRLYLGTLLCQDPETWKGLGPIVQQLAAGG